MMPLLAWWLLSLRTFASYLKILEQFKAPYILSSSCYKRSTREPSHEGQQVL